MSTMMGPARGTNQLPGNSPKGLAGGWYGPTSDQGTFQNGFALQNVQANPNGLDFSQPGYEAQAAAGTPPAPEAPPPGPPAESGGGGHPFMSFIMNLLGGMGGGGFPSRAGGAGLMGGLLGAGGDAKGPGGSLGGMFAGQGQSPEIDKLMQGNSGFNGLNADAISRFSQMKNGFGGQR